ncbi:hypothetical protein ACIA6D_17325 [Streptomyces cacaoi]
MTASHEYAQSPTRNSGAGAVSRFATSTSLTRPCVRSARESGGRSPSTILATSSRRRTRQRQAISVRDLTPDQVDMFTACAHTIEKSVRDHRRQAPVG